MPPLKALASLTAGMLLASTFGAAAPASAQGAMDFRELGYFQGNPFAPVQVIEFADIGCSACGMFHREVKPALVEEFIETGRVGWRMIPIRLARFRHSPQATRAIQCAAPQDGFFALEQKLYEEQKEWQGARQPDGMIEGFVRSLGMDVGAWRACYRNSSAPDPVEIHNQIARNLAVRGTPTFLINDRRALGALPYEQFVSILEQVEAEAFR